MKTTIKHIALGLAISATALGASAFTNVQQPEKASQAGELFWYEFDSENNVVGDQILSGQIEKSSAESETGCQTLTLPNCARGYENPQTTGQPQTESPADFLSHP